MEMMRETETERETEVGTLRNLVTALEEATRMAKQLPNTTDPSQILQIYSAFHSAQNNLSYFLSHSLLTPAGENSVSSAVGNDDDDDDEPMQLGDEEQNSKATIDKVEERMRDCFIQNKRPKRPLSPSADKRNRQDQDFGNGLPEFDPYGDRLRALDLIYQFHA